MSHIAINRLAVGAVVLGMMSLQANALADTLPFEQHIEVETTNRPFFTTPPQPDPGGITNNLKYSGNVAAGTSSTSTVTGSNLKIVGTGTISEGGNGLPQGVELRFTVVFDVSATGGGKLMDGTNQGLGVSTSPEAANNSFLNATAPTGDQLFFNTISITSFSVLDPVGFLEPGATVDSPLWNVLSSSTHGGTDEVKTSSNSAVSADVTRFLDNVSGGADAIANMFASGQFSPLPSVYVTTIAGDWRLKGIGYTVNVNADLADAPNRRSFNFKDPLATYDGAATHSVTDNDVTVTITPIGNLAALDTNDLGVGVNSSDDDLLPDMVTPASGGQQRRIDGTLGNPESLQFVFDQDVSLESLLFDSLNISDGTEAVVLKYVSGGSNPFEGGLSGYSSDYTIGADSITFMTTTGSLDPFPVTFGKNGQEVIVEAGTVLSITGNPANNGGVLLMRITANVIEEVVVDADFDDDDDVDGDDLATWETNFGPGSDPFTGDADGDGAADGADFLQWQRELNIPMETAAPVPEPSTAALLLLAGAACWRAARRSAT